MVLINTGTTGKPNRSTAHPSLFNESSDFHTVFFRASNKSKRMEKNQCILLFSRTSSLFQGQFYKIPGQFQDKWQYFEIPGVFQDQGQIQGLFQVCANPDFTVYMRLIVIAANIFLTHLNINAYWIMVEFVLAGMTLDFSDYMLPIHSDSTIFVFYPCLLI